MKTKILRKQACMLVLAGIMACGASGTALADPYIIQDWNYEVDGIFVNWVDSNGRMGRYNDPRTPVNENPTGIRPGYAVVKNPDGTINLTNQAVRAETLSYAFLKGEEAPGSATGYRSLSWGTGSNSAIGIVANSGSVHTDYVPYTESLGTTVWHNNQPISGTTLTSGTALMTLTLTPLANTGSDVTTLNDGTVLGQALPTFATELEFYFLETSNTFPDGDQRNNDIFILKDPFENGIANGAFTLDEVDYTFSFGGTFRELTGYSLRLAQEALRVASTTTLYGWTTEEGAMTSFLTSLSIHYQTEPPPYVPPSAVPEPGTLLLFGTGLMGLAAFGRRRRTV